MTLAIGQGYTSQVCAGDLAPIAVSFPVFTNGDGSIDLTIELRDATTNALLETAVYPTHYTFTRAAAPAIGGTITPLSASVFASGRKAWAFRNTKVHQESRLPELVKFPAVATEDALDRLTAIAQDLRRESLRAIKVAPGAAAFEVSADDFNTIAENIEAIVAFASGFLTLGGVDQTVSSGKSFAGVLASDKADNNWGLLLRSEDGVDHRGGLWVESGRLGFGNGDHFLWIDGAGELKRNKGRVHYSVDLTPDGVWSYNPAGLTGTDNRAALIAIMQARETDGGGVVRLDRGAFRLVGVSGQPVLTMNNKVSLWGDSQYHHAFAESGQRGGSILYLQVPDGGDGMVFEVNNGEGGNGLRDVSVYGINIGANYSAIMRIRGVLHHSLENIEIAGFNHVTGAGTADYGLTVEPDAVNSAVLALYGSHRNVQIKGHIKTALKIDRDSNANNWHDVVLQGLRCCLELTGDASLQPRGFGFFGGAFEAVFNRPEREYIWLAAGSAARRKLVGVSYGGDPDGGVWITPVVKATHAVRVGFHSTYLEIGFPALLTVRVASTAAITISSGLVNGQTLDGVSLVTGDRVLCKNQSAGAENGIWIVGASVGTATRATDADTGAEIGDRTVYVTAGSTNAATYWSCDQAAPTVGVTALTFTSRPAYPWHDDGTNNGPLVPVVYLADTGYVQDITLNALDWVNVRLWDGGINTKVIGYWDGSDYGTRQSPRVIARKIGDQSIPDATGTAVDLAGADIGDLMGHLEWDATNKRWIVNQAGTYEVGPANIFWETIATASYVATRIKITGSLTLTFEGMRGQHEAAAQSLTVAAYAGPLKLAAGDTIGVEAFQNTGGAATIKGYVGATGMRIRRIN